MEHVKLVFCLKGAVIDAVVDLRKSSPTYGKHELFKLSDEYPRIIYIPKGLAHGFYVTSADAVMFYQVSTSYSPDHDCGILWNSIDIPWPDKKPIISKRDESFPAFNDYQTPFYS
jgi:dTDP-4-dehydrorhamnose 3,5-epimerase